MRTISLEKLQNKIGLLNESHRSKLVYIWQNSNMSVPIIDASLRNRVSSRLTDRNTENNQQQVTLTSGEVNKFYVANRERISALC